MMEQLKASRREKMIYREALLREIRQSNSTADLGRCSLVVKAGAALGLATFNCVTGGCSDDLNPIFDAVDELIEKGFAEYHIDKPSNEDLWTLLPKGRLWLKRKNPCRRLNRRTAV